MTQVEQLGRRVRHGAVSLHRDHLVGCRGSGLPFDMGVQLIERFAAHATKAAVLEEQHRPLARFCYGGIQRLDVGQGRQACHVK